MHQKFSSLLQLITDPKPEKIEDKNHLMSKMVDTYPQEEVVFQLKEWRPPRTTGASGRRAPPSPVNTMCVKVYEFGLRETRVASTNFITSNYRKISRLN